MFYLIVSSVCFVIQSIGAVFRLVLSPTFQNKEVVMAYRIYEVTGNRFTRYRQREVERLLSDAGIVRNRLKMQVALTNARLFTQHLP